MTYHTHNSGEQVRYRTRNSYERVQNLSHVIAHVVITMCAICHTRTHFSWYRLPTVESCMRITFLTYQKGVLGNYWQIKNLAILGNRFFVTGLKRS